MIKVVEIESESGEKFVAAGAPEKGLGNFEMLPLYELSPIPKKWNEVGKWPNILKFRNDLIEGKTRMITLKTFAEEYGELFDY